MEIKVKKDKYGKYTLGLFNARDLGLGQKGVVFVNLEGEGLKEGMLVEVDFNGLKVTKTAKKDKRGNDIFVAVVSNFKVIYNTRNIVFKKETSEYTGDVYSGDVFLYRKNFPTEVGFWYFKNFNPFKIVGDPAVDKVIVWRRLYINEKDERYYGIGKYSVETESYHLPVSHPDIPLYIKDEYEENLKYKIQIVDKKREEYERQKKYLLSASILHKCKEDFIDDILSGEYGIHDIGGRDIYGDGSPLCGNENEIFYVGSYNFVPIIEEYDEDFIKYAENKVFPQCSYDVKEIIEDVINFIIEDDSYLYIPRFLRSVIFDNLFLNKINRKYIQIKEKLHRGIYIEGRENKSPQVYERGNQEIENINIQITEDIKNILLSEKPVKIDNKYLSLIIVPCFWLVEAHYEDVSEEGLGLESLSVIENKSIGVLVDYDVSFELKFNFGEKIKEKIIREIECVGGGLNNYTFRKLKKINI